jgi:hypothetical protein
MKMILYQNLMNNESTIQPSPSWLWLPGCHHGGATSANSASCAALLGREIPPCGARPRPLIGAFSCRACGLRQTAFGGFTYAGGVERHSTRRPAHCKIKQGLTFTSSNNN